MRIVLDTNVVVSGLLSEVGPPGWIVDLVVAGELEAVYDARILAEYREVLTRARLALPGEQLEAFLRYIEHRGLEVTAPPWQNRLRDRDDEPFLAVAAAASATLVTGNLRHFPARSRGGVLVLSPRQFLDCWPKS
ncbi:MAG: putative toxin-antitoxin system toxin component, PIN family [Candidatus Binatia bacterium]